MRDTPYEELCGIAARGLLLILCNSITDNITDLIESHKKPNIQL